MKQTILSEKEWPLLTSAIAKLDPEIFSHPVWIGFGTQGVSSPLALIDDLLRAAERLEEDDPGGACQVLLICAACQNSVGRRDNGLRTAQQALALAERSGLAKETIWATWGAAAVCFQKKNYEQAAGYLEYLQAGLSEQNEWILADFVEVVKQFLLRPRSVSTCKQSGLRDDQSPGDLLTLTFDWLRQWGVPQSPTSSRDNNERHAGWRLSHLQSSLSLIWSTLSSRINVSRIAHSLPERTQVSFFLPPSTEEPSDQVLSDEFGPGAKSDEVAGHAAVIPAVVQMLGPFSLTIQNAPVKMPASRCLSLLKYLLLHHKQDIPREVLMDIFWPDADPDAARNNLNVAMHNLRHALRAVTDLAVIHFENGAYGLTSDLEIWLDIEEFDRCNKEGKQLEVRNQLTAAVAEYEIAINLYRGDLLVDSPYEDWSTLERERLRISYLDILDHLSQIYYSQERFASCATLCQLILNRDLCREDAHCRLMRCFSRLGQTSLALRQYQICVEALRDELDVGPAPESRQLYEHIRHRESI